MADTEINGLPDAVAALGDFVHANDISNANASFRATLQEIIELYNAFVATQTNKSISLTTNTITGTSAELATAISDETGSGALVFATTPTINNPAFLDAALDHTYQVAVADLLGNVNITLPLLTGSDTFVFEAHAQSLTNKIIDDESNTVIADATHIFVRNQSGGAMAKGDVVYISGYNIGADKPEISLADASTQSTTPSVGLVFDAALPNGSNGVICVTGRMQNLDTSSFAAGDELYVSETPGEFTNVKPTGTALIQKIGTVLRSHATLGVVEIGYQFADHVDIQTAQTVTGVKTMTSPVLVTPTIASFTNSQHDHENAAGGGVLAKAAIPTTTVYEDEANSWGTSNQNISATGKWQEAGVNISPIGLHDIWIGATAMWETTTAGAATLAKTELATNDINIQTFDFDQTTEENVQFSVVLPRNYNNGTITVTPYWTAAAGTGTVKWDIKAVAISNDDPIDAAFGTLQGSTDTLLATDDMHIGPDTTALTIGGTPADSDYIQFNIARDVATDTLTADAKLIGVSIHITTDAAVSA